MKTLRLGSGGFGLIETLVIFAIFSMALLSLSYLSVYLSRGSAHLADLEAINAFRQSFVTLITDDPSWKATIARNGNMACLSGGRGSGCSVYTFRTINLYTASGSLVYNSTTTTNGINLFGIPCGPNSTAGTPYTSYRYPSTNCPLRFTLQWAAMDNNPYPVVALAVTLTIGRASSGAPFTDLIFNPTNYSYPVIGRWPPQPGQWPSTLIYRHAIP